MKFTVEIELGNDGMRTNADVAAALEALAQRLEDLGAGWAPPQAEGTIMDGNGNTVGRWGTISTPPVFICRGCGREESICSADPCPSVIADRNT